MKKLVLAAIAAAFVFVSVSNAVAGNKSESYNNVVPTDTVAPADTTNTPQQPADTTTHTTTAPNYTAE